MSWTAVFPNGGFFKDDKDFVCFGVVVAVTMNAVREGTADPVKVVETLWAASRPETEKEMIDFSEPLNRRIAEDGWLVKLGLPEGTPFRAIGVKILDESRGLLVSTLAVGTQLPDAPDTPEEYVEEFNQIVAEAAAEAGFTIEHRHLDDDAILMQSPGMDTALRSEVDRQIAAETEKFRGELDKVFDTWKGET